eukprot:12575498-Prorocentrum_lima.AAC.1
MTSSLVGSEMCIRDRMKGASGRAWKPGKATGSLGRGCCARVMTSDEWEAVSYTHLTLPTICSV